MLTGEIKYLLILYSGTIFFNVLISIWLWSKNRAPVYSSLLRMWAGLFLVLVLSGATNTNPFAFVLIGMFPGTYIAISATCGILLSFIGELPPLRKIRMIYAAGAILTVILYALGSPFVVYAGPISLIGFGEFAYCLQRLIRAKREKLSPAQMGLALMAATMMIHYLDFPFIANDPDMVVAGFTIGIFIAFGTSIFAPMAIVERSSAEAVKLKFERQVLEKELEVTTAVQSLLLPQTRDCLLPQARVCSHYKPAVRAGGDWWWYGETASKRTHLLIGDVTGHGADSAMVTAVVASSYQTLVSVRPSASIAEILEELNKSMIKACSGRYHMTMLIIEVDSSGKRYQWAMAGAPSIYHLPRDGAPEILGGAGMPLGSSDFSISEGEHSLEAGDKILAFTDGVIDLRIEGDRPLGRRQWLKFFEESRGRSLESVRDHLVERIDEFKLKSPFDDDVTFVLLEQRNALLSI